MKYPRYPTYKECQVPGVNSVPSHWAVVPIKHIASSNDDVLTEDTSEDYVIEYVEISSVDGVKGILSTETCQFKNAPSRARRRVQHGDVIVSTVRTYLKAIASVEHPVDNLVVSTGFAVIRPRASLYPRFASYLFKTNYVVDEVIARSVGVSYPAINPSELVRIHAVVPPLNEQIAVAAFLDREIAKIDALIAKQERLIAVLQEKRQALISHAVTRGLNPDALVKDRGLEWLGEVPAHWGLTKVGHVSKVVRGQTPRPAGDPKYFNGDFIPWITVGEITKDESIYLTSTQTMLTELGLTIRWNWIHVCRIVAKAE